MENPDPKNIERRKNEILDIILADDSKKKILYQMIRDVSTCFTIDEVLDSTPNPIYYGFKQNDIDIIQFDKVAKGEEREILKLILCDKSLIELVCENRC